MTPEDEIIRANDAKGVLNSKVFLEAKDKIREGILHQMAKVPVSEQDMHTRLIITLQLWNHLESYLQGIEQTGKLANFQVEAQKRKLFG